jgi:hypothetical protein
MKVNFDATVEDFVDVHKRSAGNNLLSYLIMAVVTLVVSGTAGGLMYLIFRDWLVSAILVTVSLTVGGFALASVQEQNIRAFLRKRLKLNAPVPTEVEINESGVLTRCMGQTVIQEWKVIENIEETNDAIYFRNTFGLYCSARKRGFSSEDEMKEFLDLAKHYWSRATVPEPPAFESQA